MRSFLIISLLFLPAVSVGAPNFHTPGVRAGISSTTVISFPSRRRAEHTAAEKAWRSFFPRFRSAVRRRDRAAVRRMMAREFLYSFGGNLDRDEALRYWDTADTGAWRAFETMLGRGAVRTEGTDTEGQPVPARIAPPVAKRQGYTGWRAYFKYGKDGRWRCTGFVQGD